MGAGPANVNCVETGNTAADCLSTCAAGDGACPANVNCVETGNTAAECTVDCKAVAVVTTVQSGKGAACLGDHACLAGEGACPAANTANCVQEHETNCASDKMITTQQECELCAKHLNLAWYQAIDDQGNMPGCFVGGSVMFNVHVDATGDAYENWSEGVNIGTYALCKA